MKFKTWLERRSLKVKPKGWQIVKPDFDWSSSEKMPDDSVEEKLPFGNVRKMKLGDFLEKLEKSLNKNLIWINDLKKEPIKVPEIVWNAINSINDEISSGEVVPFRQVYRGTVKFGDFIDKFQDLKNKKELHNEILELNGDIFDTLNMSAEFNENFYCNNNSKQAD